MVQQDIMDTTAHYAWPSRLSRRPNPARFPVMHPPKPLKYFLRLALFAMPFFPPCQQLSFLLSSVLGILALSLSRPS